MPLIKFRQSVEDGTELGAIYVNTDQIVSIGPGDKATEVRTADGRTVWVKQTSEELVAMVMVG